MNKENDVIFLKNVLPRQLLSDSAYKSFFVARSRDISQKGAPKITDRIEKQSQMKLTSSAFENNEMIPKKYTCDGENINPPLSISGVNPDAQALVLIMHDQDAPIAGGWTHWILMNMPVETSEINEDSVPENATEAQTSAGTQGYGGPCPPRVDERLSSRVEAGPPSGTHHYEFRLYALDSMLSIDERAKKTQIEHEMEGHVIEHTVLVGLYSHSK